ncbi:replication initiator protein A [Planctomyces sp. SH-PL62]|uniref:replication initiator protein A n=1 Tax=Planctomyces sp. SH-PL62 TaxID=1636152 RepID=UPI00078C76C3|nr:replication initiator protein A [Planctomyces sp. SH-PL62]AMV40226.1 Replication initiator protein A [Planctomyces sp. SH-PL62]
MAKRPPPPSDSQPDLFAASFADIPIRDQRDTMERPFFSLAKKPRHAPIEYQVGDVWVEVSANPKFGMATIWDADILIWASTQVTEALDRELKPSRTIHFHPYNLLKAIRRETGGEHYRRLRAALDRLTHTAVRTNIRGHGKKKIASFHWLESWTEVIDEATGETTGMTMTLPDWLYDGVLMRGGVLTIHEDYFLLTGGIERWLYRVARKHAGQQELGWSFTMRQLFEKSGSTARFSDFAIDVRKAVEGNALPEYSMAIHKNDEGEEVVNFVRRSQLAVEDPNFESPRYARRRLAGASSRKSKRFSNIEP